MTSAVHHESAGFLGALYGRVTSPLGAARGAAVIVPPCAEEKKAAHRTLVEAARAVARTGWDVFHLDLRGTGDSGGEHGELGLDDWVDDVVRALDHQRERYAGAPLALVGLRLGALLAWLAAQQRQVEQLVLLEPVLAGAGYLRQCRQRSQLRAQLTAADGVLREESGSFDFDGFAIGPKLAEQLNGADLLTADLPEAAQTRLVQISGSSRPKKPNLDLVERLTSSGHRANLEQVGIEAFWGSIGLIDTSSLNDVLVAGLPASQHKDDAAPPGLEPISTTVAPGRQVEVREFVSGEQMVRGVLYRPQGEVSRCALLLHGWSGYRLGPGALLRRAARELSAAGVAVYTFDFRGRGDSDWEVGEASLNSMIRDAARAVPLVLEWSGAQHVALVGLCSGAEVALGASLSHPAIDRLALWSAPIFSGNFDLARRARRSSKMVREYWRKLWRAESWAKLLGGQLNWRLIGRALSGGRSAEDAQVTDKAPDTSTQMAEFRDWPGRLLLVYGGADPETVPSRDFYLAHMQASSQPLELVEVEGANHNFFSLRWQEQVLSATMAWLGKA